MTFDHRLSVEHQLREVRVVQDLFMDKGCHKVVEQAGPCLSHAAK